MDYPSFAKLLPAVYPRLVRVRQRFARPRVEDVRAEVRRQLSQDWVRARVKPKSRVALAVGSRGIAGLPLVVRAIVEELRKAGAEPLVMPAMGSHGGATAEGQIAVLASLGVTKETAGAEILSSMEVARIGAFATGEPICVARDALLADAVIPVNRVKLHTSFRGPVESGLMKMLAVGLGKHLGTVSIHAQGFERLAERIVTAARTVMQQVRIPFGVAILENAFEELALIEVVEAERLEQREQELLGRSRELMARILFDEMDVLVVERMGKEISGTGMDPNITGKFAFPWLTGGPKVGRLVVLDLTEKSHGNACGVGLADITTRRLVEKIDFYATYINNITSTNLLSGKIPVTMPNDREAIALALAMSAAAEPARAKVVRIKDTCTLEEIMVSAELLAASGPREDIEILGQPEPMRFDREGNLVGGW